MSGRLLLVTANLPPAAGPAGIRSQQLLRRLPGAGWTLRAVAPRLPGWEQADQLWAGKIRRTRAPAYMRAAVVPGPGPDSDPGAPSRHRSSVRALTRSCYLWSTRHLLVPDELVGWVPFGLSAAVRETRRFGPDVLLVTAPYFSAALVGRATSRLQGVPLVLDMQDPWSGNPYADHGRPRALVERIQEQWVMQGAALTILSSERQAADYRARYPRARVAAFVNGFDGAELAGVGSPGLVAPRRPFLVHTGSFYGGRSARPLLEGFTAYRARGGTARLLLVGEWDDRRRAEAAQLLSTPGVEVHRPVPRREALALVKAASAAVVVTDGGYAGEALLPAKLFEAMGLGTPVLALAPHGETAELVRRLGLGQVAPPHDVEAIRAGIEVVMRRPRISPEAAADYEWSVLVERYAELLQSVLRVPAGASSP